MKIDQVLEGISTALENFLASEKLKYHVFNSIRVSIFIENWEKLNFQKKISPFSRDNLPIFLTF